MKDTDYQKLLSPLSFEQAEGRLREAGRLLLSWYKTAARSLPWRQTKDPYAIWVSEVMLQQTRVETVIPYYQRFLAVLPDIKALAEADEMQLHKLWEGLGYYSRARNLQRAARQIIADHGGRMPQSRETLLTLCGIGSYTAGAVASIAFGERVPAVDGNVLRVVSRLLAAEGDILSPSVRKAVETLLLGQMPDDAGSFNQAVMDLGAGVCLPHGEPKCGVCPLSGCCLAFQLEQQQAFPVKSPKAKRRIEERTVFLIRTEKDETLLRRRPEEGLLAGLWEFPNAEGQLSRKEAAALLAERGIIPQKLQTLGQAKHIFTHLEWRMTGYLAWCSEIAPQPGEVLAADEERQQRYTIPSAFDAYKQLLDSMMQDSMIKEEGR